MAILVGDSIGLSIEDNLNCHVLVDAFVGRQFSTGVDIVREYREARQLHKHMVIELGTNGPISSVDMTEMLRLLGPKRLVWFVTNYVPKPWQRANNRLIHKVVRENENINLIPWRAVASKRPEWFEVDPLHTHPNADGQAVLATLVCAAIA